MIVSLEVSQLWLRLNLGHVCFVLPSNATVWAAKAACIIRGQQQRAATAKMQDGVAAAGGSNNKDANMNTPIMLYIITLGCDARSIGSILSAAAWIYSVAKQMSRVIDSVACHTFTIHRRLCWQLPGYVGLYWSVQELNAYTRHVEARTLVFFVRGKCKHISYCSSKMYILCKQSFLLCLIWKECFGGGGLSFFSVINITLDDWTS